MRTSVAVVIAVSLVIVAIIGVPWDESTGNPTQDLLAGGASSVFCSDTGSAGDFNLVSNPSFEDGDINGNCWGFSAGGETTNRVTSDAVVGESSAEVITAASGGGITTQNPLHQWAISIGVTYSFGAWVKAPAGLSMVLDHDELSAADAFLRRTRVLFTGTGRWERIKGTGTIGASAAWGLIRVATNGNPGFAQTFYVDGVWVVETRRAVADRPHAEHSVR